MLDYLPTEFTFGNRAPSKLPCGMKQFDVDKVDIEQLQSLWLQKLSENTHSILVCPDSSFWICCPPVSIKSMKLTQRYRTPFMHTLLQKYRNITTKRSLSEPVQRHINNTCSSFSKLRPLPPQKPEITRKEFK